MKYTIEDFDYRLPKNLIAQKPAHPRDHARLLVFDRKDGSIRDDYFYNIGDFLPQASTLVVNNSKVEKARLNFNGIEVFLLETVNDRTAIAFVRPGKKFKLDRRVILADGIEAEVIDVNKQGHRTLEFNKPLSDSVFKEFKLTPFPPYIRQDESLADEYQTVYADPLGSKAAPTAGLHFTEELLNEISNAHNIAEVTLHVGLGTFAPLTKENLENEALHEERFLISDENAKLINQAKHITAVGTTSARVLESQGRPAKPGSFETDIFIQPGYLFKAIDSLVTNFHLPKSSLLMLVSALMGHREMMMVYRHAIEKQYRFYSFGDAMLVI